MKLICRLVQSMPPSDFIWVTNQQRVSINGAAAKIRARGGYYNKKLESILTDKLSLQNLRFQPLIQIFFHPKPLRIILVSLTNMVQVEGYDRIIVE